MNMLKNYNEDMNKSFYVVCKNTNIQYCKNSSKNENRNRFTKENLN